MTKPKFGKWTKVEDGLPVEVGEVLVRIEESENSDSFTTIGQYWNGANSWYIVDEGCWELEHDISGKITHWMPKPSNDIKKDAFTELRELLDEAEKDNREKYPDESNMTYILRQMREVIE